MTLILQIVGWLWIVLGIWWFIRPQGIWKRLEKNFRKKLRTVLIAVLFSIGGVLIAAGRHLGGLAAWVIPIVGIVVALKGLLFLRGRLSDRVLDWWAVQPMSVYRMAALGLVGLGLLLEWAAARGATA